MQQNYYFFIDESGDHGLNKIDPNFPAFVLCGIIMSDSDYKKLNSEFKKIKKDIWGNDNVVFHSSDIRKWKKEFSLLVDPTIRQNFFQAINDCLSSCNYSIISAAIKKDDYTKKYGVLNDVYSISLSFMLERLIFFLDKKTDVKSVHIAIEKRGKKEDNKLLKYCNMVCDRGTYYVESHRFKSIIGGFHFVDKKQNVNGLQLSDLVAYPIATHVINPAKANPSFDIVKGNFYVNPSGDYMGWGLKTYP
ncbi:MAG: DUF3800 domain-containing protein [Saprospiraceae bacterium]|nr:DUF3800 domain-containing protein [Saprospiraceae bacterium]